ncbi:MAG TPA: serine/threonine-protein kinase [Planktothrix sp.]
MNTGHNRTIKKRCPACEREFTGTLVVCQHDGTLLIPVKESLVGQVLANKYTVLQEIGQGGMSIVYKGRHEVMDRTVAIKMLQSQLLGDQTSILRFQREAQAVACVSHPNVITIYDCDVHNGQPYLVMDYLIGESLADMIKRDNHISVERCLKIFICVTDALQQAHSKGVIHRDLKSSNIMLVESEGKKEVVKVVDFGIAKLMPSSGKQSQNLTQTGEIFGSPIYMSPEQCQGLPLDARSDIYSCGVMMYEALTGLPPLMGETIVDTMQMHVSSRPPAFREIRPDLYIPTPLEQIVFRALEKRPEGRFPTMEELKETLQHVQTKLQGGEFAHEQTGSRAALGRPARSTRQNLATSIAPGHLPKPMLDMPSNSSSARHEAIKKNALDSSTGLHSFKVGNLNRVDDDAEEEPHKRGWMIPAAIVMFILAIIGIVMKIFIQHP